MSRKRYISTDLSLSGKVEELARRAGEYAVILWTWLIPHLDDWGRMDGEPDKVFFTVTPRFAVLGRTPDDAEKALQAMHDLGLITWYEVDGHRYIQVNPDTFYALQTYIPKAKREEDKSAYPAPPSDDPTKGSAARNKVAQCAEEREQTAQENTERDSVAQSSAARDCALSSVPSPSPSPSRDMQASMQANNARTCARDEQDDQSDAAKVMQACERAFGLALNPLQTERLLSYLDDGMEADLLCLAIEKAAMAGKDIRYALGIAESWWQKGIRTRQAAQREKRQFKLIAGGNRGGRTQEGSREDSAYAGFDLNQLSL
ncbi:MAG: hypothetical protein BLM47_00185 [Candidatus Reconcilbacillus cellulovorans]|uniref:DnaB/C C-terminal domain-containing protein n=1 Tax=Candidatus Reconcilbacillus cellulovorans TaxID=1906605 RepID=A0A2A6E379_9BACL|nr:MAG: hypothetical protein BLM47_00185 [Candidatus Reconcilbacillus cellulovorans]